MRLALLVAAIVALWLMLKSMGDAATSSPSAGNGAPTSAGYGDGLDTLSEGVARFEGFYKDGSKAQRTNNPGNVGTYGDKNTSFADVGDGWDRLNSYLAGLVAAHPDWNFYQLFHYYLTGDPNGTPGPNQDPNAYAEYVASYAGADPTQTVSSYLGS